MKYLIIDTSTDLCIIALANGQTLLTEEIFPHRNLLSKTLLPAIEAILTRNNLSLQALDIIAVGIGPGSYTGTRLGVAVAKGLAFGAQLPIKAFSSPLAFLPADMGTFSFLLPTRAGPYFHLKGTRSTEGTSQESAALAQPEDLAQQIQGADFLICPDPQALPASLRTKPCHIPHPNLIGLCQALPSLSLLDPEHVELQYLHTP